MLMWEALSHGLGSWTAQNGIKIKAGQGQHSLCFPTHRDVNKQSCASAYSLGPFLLTNLHNDGMFP